MTIREHEGQTHWSCSSSEQLRSKREIERLRMWSRQDLSGLLRLLDATSDSDNRGPASSERIRAGSSDARNTWHFRVFVQQNNCLRIK